MKIIFAFFISSILMFYIYFLDSNIEKKEFIKNNVISLNKKIDFSKFSIKDYKNNIISLSKFKNNIIIINFFEPWCKSCNEEFTLLNNFAKIYKNISIISLSTLKVDKNFMKNFSYNNINFYYYNDEKLSNYLKIKEIPLTLIIYKGVIIYKITGKYNFLNSSFINIIKKLN